MKRSNCYLFAALCSVVLGTRAEPQEPTAKSDLWILSGQSNACGRAKLPGPEPDVRVTHFDPTARTFVVAQDPLPGMGTEGVGPWVAAAQEVAKRGIAVRMVGFASGGKPIGFWHPGKPGHLGLMPRITQYGQGAHVFLWYQGESNTSRQEEVATYKAELQRLVAEVRQRANRPDMIAVIVQLGPNTRKTTEPRDYPGLREAQRQFVVEDDHALLVPALGRTLKDTVHLDNAGYRELGRELGRALLRTRHNIDEGHWPGPVLDQAVLGTDGTTITAHFAEVRKLSGCTAGDFAVDDVQGRLDCASARASNTLITLRLARKIRLPATLTYAPGNQPRATLTDEVGNRAPAVKISVQTGPVPEDRPTAAPNGAGRNRSD